MPQAPVRLHYQGDVALEDFLELLPAYINLARRKRAALQLDVGVADQLVMYLRQYDATRKLQGDTECQSNATNATTAKQSTLNQLRRELTDAETAHHEQPLIRGRRND